MTIHSWAALLAGLLLAQAAGDPVDALRQALINPGTAAQPRDRNLAEAAGRLRSLPELARALTLPEWRDADFDPQIAAIDGKHRAILATRFQQTAHAVFDHGSPSNQLAAIDLVSRLGTAGSNVDLGRSLVPDLAQLALHGHPTVREAALRCLGRIGSEPAVLLPVLRELLPTGSPASRRAAIDALFSLIQRSAARTAPGQGGTLPEFLETARALLPLAGVGMEDDDAAIRRIALSALNLVVATAVPLLPLEKGGAGPEPEIHALLRVIRNHVPAINRVLGDPDPNLRLLARQTVEEIGRLYSLAPRRAGPAADNDPLSAMLRTLARGLSDPDVRLRRATLAALETWGVASAPAADAIYDALDDTDRFIRWGAARLVGMIGPTPLRDAVPMLLRLLYDSDVDLRLAGVSALQFYGPQAAPAAARLSDMAVWPEELAVRLAALRTMGTIGKASAPATVPVLIKALTDPEPVVRLTSAQSLGMIGPAALPAAPALKKLLDDPSPEIREMADWALPCVLAKEKKPGSAISPSPNSR